MLLTSSSEKRNDAVIEFKLPELGENIEQGDLVRLMVAPGASVSAGQSVMELETDKAVVEVPSSVTGTIQEIKVKEGDKIKGGQVIFTVDGEDDLADFDFVALFDFNFLDGSGHGRRHFDYGLVSFKFHDRLTSADGGSGRNHEAHEVALFDVFSQFGKFEFDHRVVPFLRA